MKRKSLNKAWLGFSKDFDRDFWFISCILPASALGIGQKCRHYLHCVFTAVFQRSFATSHECNRIKHGNIIFFIHGFGQTSFFVKLCCLVAGSGISKMWHFHLHRHRFWPVACTHLTLTRLNKQTDTFISLFTVICSDQC